MSTAVVKNRESSSTTIQWVQSILKTAIFVSIIFASVSSRLFAVIRFESIIHEFDPWFNFRATKYLVENSFNDFLNWFDDRTWYPLGRVTGGTLYPGLMTTSGLVWHIFKDYLGLPIDIRNICVMFAPAFSGITAYATYKLTCEIKDESAGLLAAAFIGIVPGYISRSVAGSYDNEAIAITLLMVTFMFWIKAMKYGSILNGCLAALFYFYMVSAWGGYVFITNLIPFHVFCLILMGRYNPKIYVAYNTWFVIGTIASMQIPFVGFLPIKSNDHMSALGVFGLLQIVALGNFVKGKVSSGKFKIIMVVSMITLIAVGVLGLFALTYMGLIAPWTGRFYSLWDTSYAKIHIPIIASVSEHQPVTWPAFFFDTQFLIWLFPAGVLLLFLELRDEHVFIIAYSVLCSYFAGVMIRLMLTLTPVICIAAAVALSKIFDIYLDFSSIFFNDGKDKKVEPRKKVLSLITKLFVSATFIFYLYLFVYHCTWVTQTAYSSPSVVLPSQGPDGRPALIDDYREAYYWLRMNTKEDAKVAAWWDYGYQIGGMADRTTLVDNNTWNNTHIALIGKAMASPEEISYKVLKELDVDYVLIIFGGVLGFGGDDINKFLWMIRISQGIWPDEISERNFFTSNGEYKVDSSATETMKKSLLYKMSYKDFPELFGGRGEGMDRVRHQTIRSEDVEALDYFEEAFTSENWLVRIYKLRDLDDEGRNFRDVGKFNRLSEKFLRKRSLNKKPAIDMLI
ncbi:hypothetical protein KAFR_0F03180 [Kazachstania africana CBS 2517]|uniref:dolichyl-diphosphooligosaccharide--protein glycotransferase n=1 Tax=Kazachstania africana (strain ATCC 22294 / BCRC 22015 / CBS 2517 / CECT 1963 / NBRC 1671 / NRRL Y-8276) TaxID=1071382 RepID=H2AX14_KAZAF|nr:hypothetical protein KAFR_0F03180 [Kazachstania africana CBS 2517]CCF58914.1 hypothetical protein KAFR_0F03180 [Kazachstania africana CBS 2517]